MKEIKFRAWDKASNKMLRTGDLWLPSHVKRLRSQSFPITVTNAGILYDRGTPDDDYYVVVHKGKDCIGSFYCNWDETLLYTNCELMQYTGLHDKNGKEIYEGDIVNLLLPAFGIDENTVVEWDDRKACYTTMLEEWHREVIGNIYENPQENTNA